MFLYDYICFTVTEYYITDHYLPQIHSFEWARGAIDIVEKVWYIVIGLMSLLCQMGLPPQGTLPGKDNKEGLC